MKHFVLYILLCLLVCGCNNTNTIQQTLVRVDEIMQEQPDSALHLLKRIDIKTLKNKRMIAQHALLYSQALDKNCIDIADDSIIQKAVVYYKNNGSMQDRAKCFYYQGVVYNNANKLDTAIAAYTKAINYAEKSKYVTIIGLAHNAMAHALYSQKSFDDALLHFRQAREAFEKEGNLKNVLYSTVSIAFSLQSLNRFANAQEQYNKALSLAKQQQDTLQLIVISRAIASLYLENHNVKLAKAMLFQSFKKYCDFSYQEYPLLANIYLEEKILDSAVFYASAALNYEAKYKGYKKVGLYKLLSIIENTKQNYKQSLMYTQKAFNALDSLKKDERDNLVIELEKKYKTKQIQESYNQTKQYNNLLIISLILIVISMGLIIYIIRLRRKALLKKKEEEIITKNQEIDRYIHMVETMKDENTSIVEKYQAAVIQFDKSYNQKLSNVVKEKEELEQRLENALSETQAANNQNPSIDEYLEQRRQIEQKYNNLTTDYTNKSQKLRSSMDGRLSVIRKILNIAYEFDDETLFKSKIGELMFMFKQSNQISNLLSDLVDISSFCDHGLCNCLQYKYKLTEEEISICCLVNLGFKTNQISILGGYSEGYLNNKRSIIINKLIFDQQHSKNRLDVLLKDIQDSLMNQ